MSNITSCESGSFSTERTIRQQQQSEMLAQLHSPNSHTSTTTNNSNASNTQPPPVKKKRSLPGNPDPSAEVIALSPNTLVARNRFVCEICGKGFQRDQNLQLHRRGHNLPWKLKQRSSTEVVRKRVYVCPEPSCVHHNPARALGDLTGIKKHFSRKHGEKKWKCEKCSKKYAVQSDCKAHSKVCGTKEYKCDCGTIFSRRDSFITHRAFCDALNEENNKFNEGELTKMHHILQQPMPSIVAPLPIIGNKHPFSLPQELMTKPIVNKNNNINSCDPSLQLSSNMLEENVLYSSHGSATALLQKAAQMGTTMNHNNNILMDDKGFVTSMAAPSSYGIFMQQQDQISHHYDFSVNEMMDIGSGGSMGSMSGLEMFNAILDQSKALSKIIEQNNNRGVNILHAMNSGANKVGSEENVMTLDLLGIGCGEGAHGDFYGGDQLSETAVRDGLIWSNN